MKFGTFGVVVITSLLILISGQLCNIECAQHIDSDGVVAEDEAPSIHCPGDFLRSNIQAVSTIPSHSRNLDKVLPSIHEKDCVISVARFQDHPFYEPFSQQGLFQFEEVYRL
ncbi:MAG: hypothetical protein Q8S00_17985 [Deltaproteobacteria bacterium]|nr:hypothetical protein [Deltaproteobacteria bacterium]